MPLLLQAAPYAHSPAKALVPPGCPQGNSYKTGLLLPKKQTASIATGWSEPVCGRELHPLESGADSWSLFRLSSSELEKDGILVIFRVIPHNNLIPDFYLSRVGTIKPMPERA